MNIPPADGMRVAVDDLGSLVAQIFQKVPIPADHAELIADLLIDTELRGVVSHTGLCRSSAMCAPIRKARPIPIPKSRSCAKGPGAPPSAVMADLV